MREWSASREQNYTVKALIAQQAVNDVRHVESRIAVKRYRKIKQITALLALVEGTQLRGKEFLKLIRYRFRMPGKPRVVDGDVPLGETEDRKVLTGVDLDLHS